MTPATAPDLHGAWRGPACAARPRLAARLALPALLALALLLPLGWPEPAPELRLFSDGWGAALWLDLAACVSDPAGPASDAGPAATLLPLTPAQAGTADRLLLAARYLAWGLLLPLAGLGLARQARRRHPQALVLALYGLLPACLQADLNPLSARLRQALVQAWVDRWPLPEAALPWMDALALALWLGAGAALGALLLGALHGAARLAGVAVPALARALQPLGLALLLLGLTQPSAFYLRAEGAGLAWLSAARATLLLAAAVATLARGLRALRRAAPAQAPASGATATAAATATASALWLIAPAAALAHAWAMYFHWTSHHHV